VGVQEEKCRGAGRRSQKINLGWEREKKHIESQTSKTLVAATQ